MKGNCGRIISKKLHNNKNNWTVKLISQKSHALFFDRCRQPSIRDNSSSEQVVGLNGLKILSYDSMTLQF